MIRKIGSIILGLSLLVGFSACSGSDITDAKPTTGRNPVLAEVPSADETVRGEDEPPVVTLDLGNTLQERTLSGGDELPGKIIIPTTNLNAVPITAALQAVLSGTDISLSWNTGELGSRLVTVMNLSGPLPQVVDKICAAAKVFCIYRNGSLELEEQQTFIIGLPPVAKAAGGTATANSMVDAVNALIGGQAQVDEQGGNLIYTTDVKGQARVRQYLDQLRNGRPLVVLQMYIWEVTLNKDNGEGINWTKFSAGKFGPGGNNITLSGAASNFTSLATESGSVGLGAVTSGLFDTNMLLTFLSTQGRVQTISNPQVTFVSGSSASLKVGGSKRYISEVGASTTAQGSSTSSSTVTTDSIDTGLNIEASGTFDGGIVFANLKIGIKNIISLDPTTSGEQTINLPETSDENIETVIRVRPGDNLVMAGLVASNDTNDREGVPFFGGRIPTFGKESLKNRELVVVVRPSIVVFSDKIARAEKKVAEDSAPVPAPIVIDKDGTQTLHLPAALPAKTVMDTTPAKPELMSPAAATGPAPSTPIMPNTDGAPVDRSIMQRGFSHAFDELMQPVGTGGR